MIIHNEIMINPVIFFFYGQLMHRLKSPSPQLMVSMKTGSYLFSLSLNKEVGRYCLAVESFSQLMSVGVCLYLYVI